MRPVHVAVGALARAGNEVILVAGGRLAVAVDRAAASVTLREEEEEREEREGWNVRQGMGQDQECA